MYCYDNCMCSRKKLRENERHRNSEYNAQFESFSHGVATVSKY